MATVGRVTRGKDVSMGVCVKGCLLVCASLCLLIVEQQSGGSPSAEATSERVILLDTVATSRADFESLA